MRANSEARVLVNRWTFPFLKGVGAIARSQGAGHRKVVVGFFCPVLSSLVFRGQASGPPRSLDMYRIRSSILRNRIIG